MQVGGGHDGKRDVLEAGQVNKAWAQEWREGCSKAVMERGWRDVIMC